MENGEGQKTGREKEKRLYCPQKKRKKENMEGRIAWSPIRHHHKVNDEKKKQEGKKRIETP